MIPARFQIRDLTIRPAAVLAPMAGVTDTLFRRVIRGLGGCGLLMTEFTSSEGITRSAKKTLRYLYFQEDEHPITAQLFGANPAVMAEAAKMVEEIGYDAVMIGRAAATNPWIFRQMQQHAETGRYGIPDDSVRYRLLMDYYRQINAAQLPDGVGKMKQFACWFTHGVGNGSELRGIVHAARTPGEVLESVERFFVDRPTADEKNDRSAVATNEGRVVVEIEEDPAHGPAREHH